MTGLWAGSIPMLDSLPVGISQTAETLPSQFGAPGTAALLSQLSSGGEENSNQRGSDTASRKRQREQEGEEMESGRAVKIARQDLGPMVKIEAIMGVESSSQYAPTNLPNSAGSVMGSDAAQEFTPTGRPKRAVRNTAAAKQSSGNNSSSSAMDTDIKDEPPQKPAGKGKAKAKSKGKGRKGRKKNSDDEESADETEIDNPPSKESGQNGQALSSKQLKMIRMQKHNESELRRRKRLNQAFNDLASICQIDPEGNSKTRILEQALERLKAAESKAAALEQKVKDLTTGIAMAATDSKFVAAHTTRQEHKDRSSSSSSTSSTQAGSAPAAVDPRQLAEALADALAKRPIDHGYMFSHSDVPWGVVNLSGQFQDINPLLADVFRYSREEFLSGKVTLLSLTHPESLQVTYKYMSNLFHGNHYIQRVEKKYFTKDKRVLLGRVTTWLTRDTSGRPLYLNGMLEPLRWIEPEPPVQLLQTHQQTQQQQVQQVQQAQQVMQQMPQTQSQMSTGVQQHQQQQQPNTFLPYHMQTGPQPQSQSQGSMSYGYTQQLNALQQTNQSSIFSNSQPQGSQMMMGMSQQQQQVPQQNGGAGYFAPSVDQQTMTMQTQGQFLDSQQQQQQFGVGMAAYTIHVPPPQGYSPSSDSM